MRAVSKHLVSLLLAIGALGFFLGRVEIAGVNIVAWWKFALLGAGGLFLCRRFVFRIPIQPLKDWPFLALFLVVLLSDFVDQSWGYFAKPFTRWTFLVLILICALLSKAIREFLQSRFGVLVVVAIMAVFYGTAFGGKMILGDDHPSFIYRLTLLKEMFPKLPFYNPQWNAGVEARDFFATGALGPFFLFAPFLYAGALDHPEFYSLLVGIFPILLLPLGTFAAAKVLRFDRQSASIAALLSFAPSLQLFVWLFQYGTLGFICSVSVAPLVFALSYRFLFDAERPTLRTGVALLVTATFCFFWTLSTMILAPLLLFALLSLPRLIRERRILPGLFLVGAFLLLNGPWMYTFLHVSQVGSFVSGSTLPGGGETGGGIAKLLSVVKKVRELSGKVSPTLLVFAIPALLSLRGTRERIVLGGTVLWLFSLSFVGDLLKPQLELNRAHLFGTVLLIPIVARYLASELQRADRIDLLPLRALKVGLLSMGILISPLNAIANYQGKSDVLLRFAPAWVPEFAKLVRENVAPEGRGLFLGFVLHELGQSRPGVQDGGHIAPLAAWTDRELVASHFFHARWSAVDPIPAVYRKRGAEGIEAFLDLMGISEVVAFRKEWIRYCDEQPGYRRIGKAGSFVLYSRGARSRLAAGEVQSLSVSLDRLRVVPKSERVLLRYRFLPGLRVSGGEGVVMHGRHQFDEEVGGGATIPFEFIELEFSSEFLARGEAVEIGYWVDPVGR